VGGKGREGEMIYEGKPAESVSQGVNAIQCTT